MSDSTSYVRDSREPYYARVFHAEVDHGYSRIPKGRRAHAIAVHVILARHAGKERTAFPSLRRLEALTGLSRPTIIDALKELVKAGLIEVERARDEKGHKVNEYTLTLPSLVNDIDQGGKGDLPGVVNDIDQKKKQLEVETTKNTPTGRATPAQGENRWEDSSTGEKQAYLVAYLHNRLDERGLETPSPRYKQQLSGEIRNYINKGAAKADLLFALDHIVKRWRDKRLELWQAMDDVRNTNAGFARERGVPHDPRFNPDGTARIRAVEL